MANAILDLIGSPCLVSVGTKNLVVGTSGAADLVFVTNGIERLRIASDGATTLGSSVDLKLANNDYFLSRNAAGNGDLSLLKADSSDNTVLNAATGKSILLAINGTTELAITDNNLEFTGSTFTLSANTADGADNANLLLCAGGTASNAQGAYIALKGNEHASAGDLDLISGTASGSVITLQASASNGQIDCQVNGTSRLLVNSSGDTVFGGRTVAPLTPTDVDAQNNTLTVAQIAGGIVVHTSVTGGGTVTTDTATNIVAGSSGVGALTADGQCIECYYINDGTQVLTLAGGTGVTIADAGQTIAADESARLIFRRTSATTVTVYSVGA